MNLMTGLSSDGCDSTYPPPFSCLCSCSGLFFFAFLLFSHPANQCRQFGPIPQMRGLFVNRLLGSGSLPGRHTVILRFSLIALQERPQPPDLDLSGSGGFHLMVIGLFSTCICLSVVLISKAFVS